MILDFLEWSVTAFRAFLGFMASLVVTDGVSIFGIMLASIVLTIMIRSFVLRG